MTDRPDEVSHPLRTGGVGVEVGLGEAKFVGLVIVIDDRLNKQQIKTEQEISCRFGTDKCKFGSDKASIIQLILGSEEDMRRWVKRWEIYP